MFPLRINITLALAALSLVACGGSDKSTTSSQNTDDGSVQLFGAKVATTAATLPTCDSTQVGQLFYVLANQEFQFCSSEGYQSIDLTGAAGADGADGKDGANGTNGTNGSDGADGSSCSVTSNANGGKTIACADGTTATVSDGASCTVADNGNGSYDLTCSGTTVTVQDGKDGEDGTGCTLSDDHAGTLTQTCTDGSSVSWPKALCGAQAYDPETHFCGAGTVLELCGGASYDATTHFCGAGTVLELCGGASYDATTHFCNAATSAPMAAWSTYCLVAGNCGTFEDARETPAKTYKWTKIGTQTWMAENLAYLPSVNNISEFSYDDARYYVYDYDGNVVADAKTTSNYKTYGVLYNWPAASSACPSGWSLPSNGDWETLDANAGNVSIAGTQLKSINGWKTDGYRYIAGTDDYGFSALPGGHYYNPFSRVLSYGYWWSATQYDSENAFYKSMNNEDASADLSDSHRKNGFSVRCLKN